MAMPKKYFLCERGHFLLYYFIFLMLVCIFLAGCDSYDDNYQEDTGPKGGTIIFINNVDSDPLETYYERRRYIDASVSNFEVPPRSYTIYEKYLLTPNWDTDYWIPTDCNVTWRSFKKLDNGEYVRAESGWINVLGGKTSTVILFY